MQNLEKIKESRTNSAMSKNNKRGSDFGDDNEDDEDNIINKKLANNMYVKVDVR
jgi:hypothetical protein